MSSLVVALVAAAGRAGATAAPPDLRGLSIEDLANIDISSVSKADQPVSEAPAAVYVITHDDIIRSGATRLAEILRLAPNLQVAQVTATSYAISARGFNGTAADKLLVLIDGRTVYTPFFSGVFWDMQDVPPEDIERIEVISGPGATLWGANAVNGVINIITRKSSDTQGALAYAGGGPQQSRMALQYGGAIGQFLTYRIYAQTERHADDVTTTGLDARDGWRQRQAGFRFDWSADRDLVTLQGDAYDGTERQLLTNNQTVAGRNVLARWTRQLSDDSSVQVQAYYDYLERKVAGVAGDFLNTYDIEVQHNFRLGARHEIVWGAGFRRTEDRFPVVPGNITAAPYTQFFRPEERSLDLGDLFVQDTVTLSPAVRLTAGLKLEDDPYSGLQTLPNLRLSWQANDATYLWAAISRAIRAPSRLDRDFYQVLGPVVVIGPGHFEPEQLVAYELGYRGRPTARSSLSVSAFYNVYDDLRSFQPAPGGGVPITIENGLEGETYGLEAWGSYQLRDWWRLSAGANWLHEDLRVKPGSVAVGGIQTAGNDPKYQAQIRSAMDLPHDVTLDLFLRRVGALPAPESPAYTDLNGRLSWAVTRRLELSVSGLNLLHDHHLEFGTAEAHVQLGAIGVETARSVVVDARVRF